MRQNDRHLCKPRVSPLLHVHILTALALTPPARGGLASVLSNGLTTVAAITATQVGADRLRSAPRSALRNSTQATHRRQPSPT